MRFPVHSNRKNAVHVVSVPDIPLVDLAEWNPIIDEGLDVMGSVTPHGNTVKSICDGLLENRAQSFGVLVAQGRQILLVCCW